MKNIKICMIVLLSISVGTIVQAQQSAFQGTWVGGANQSRRLEISENNWSLFYNNVIQAAGTASFSTGEAKLVLANGNTFFNLTLLAPELIEARRNGGFFDDFRLIQQNVPSQSDSLPSQATDILITDQTHKITATSYKVGDIGPAGGFIFYDKGNDMGGWRYLEAAPADIDRKLYAVTEYIGSYKTLMERALGKGKSNTRIIMAEAINKVGGFGWAAQACDTLVVNGFDDWFLPSRDELHYMYGNLYLQGLGGFNDESYDGLYWSSSFNEEDDGRWETTWWCENFYTGLQEVQHALSRCYVRACRQF